MKAVQRHGMVGTYLKLLSTPRTIAIVGFLGLADGTYHFILPHLVRGHASSFDLSYDVAGEAIFFMSAVTLLVAQVLYAIDKRLKALEGKTDGG